ncbi:hypothetical protein Aduo_002962 [Ancylostoma duodenale]
MIFLEFLPNKE